MAVDVWKRNEGRFDREGWKVEDRRGWGGFFVDRVFQVTASGHSMSGKVGVDKRSGEWGWKALPRTW